MNVDLQPDPMIGRMLPDVDLEFADGRTAHLPDDWKGRWTLLYFYPADDTPGCTAQAHAYRDNIDEFKRVNVQVVGVSPDDADSHRRFTKKHQLNFPLLSDPLHVLARAMGAYAGESVSRDTFLIDPEGRVRQV
ncbi:MAG TPA: peroxiredoxin, partial [Bdellovibrionales bacterium]|nr:peroxiredoxin [Bdellovibrionales bacterium]